jgi:hypothetical protein
MSGVAVGIIETVNSTGAEKLFDWVHFADIFLMLKYDVKSLFI